MTTLFRASVVFAFCAGFSGCAGPGASSVTTGSATPANILSADDARNAVTIGKSTKSDVIAALGKTMVISFDSGFEVWVYKVKDDAAAKAGSRERIGLARSEQGNLDTMEFVVLFEPSGVVTKTRIRAAPPPGPGKGK
jgi:hypothetical protein